jgi:hypothetical protein
MTHILNRRVFVHIRIHNSGLLDKYYYLSLKNIEKLNVSSALREFMGGGYLVIAVVENDWVTAEVILSYFTFM